MPLQGGLHSMNIRVQDESGNWGPVYKKTIYASESIRDLKLPLQNFSGEVTLDREVGQLC